MRYSLKRDFEILEREKERKREREKERKREREKKRKREREKERKRKREKENSKRHPERREALLKRPVVKDLEKFYTS